MVFFHIVMFLLFQVVANIFFKWGSTAPQHYWWGFALGNAVGITSIIFLLGIYRAMPAAATYIVEDASTGERSEMPGADLQKFTVTLGKAPDGKLIFFTRRA